METIFRRSGRHGTIETFQNCPRMQHVLPHMPFHGRTAKARMSVQQILTRIQKQVRKLKLLKKWVNFSVLMPRKLKRNTKIFVMHTAIFEEECKVSGQFGAFLVVSFGV